MLTIGLLLIIAGWCLSANPQHAVVAARLIVAGIILIAIDLTLAGGLLLWHFLKC